MDKQDEDHISRSIPAQHEQEIREWEIDQTTFVQTRATRQILGSLPFHNCIVVTGSSGCGKSSNIHHIALHLRDNLGFEIIPVLTEPADILNKYNEKRRQVFVVDDNRGKETINIQNFLIWINHSEQFEKLFKVADKDTSNKTDGIISKLLISCRHRTYREAQCRSCTVISIKECNLLSSDMCLLQAERMRILQKYLPNDIIDNYVKQVTEKCDYFPLLCKLSKGKTSEEVQTLFTAPYSITWNINSIIKEKKEQFCALALCSLFDGEFDTNWLKRAPDLQKQYKLDAIVKEFHINIRNKVSRNILKSCFTSLDGTFLKLRGRKYRFIHDKIYKIIAVICGQHLTKCFIKFAPSVFIRDHFVFGSLNAVHRNDRLVLLLKDHEENYFERLLCDLKECVISSTFHNKQLMYQLFMDKLLSFFGRSAEAITVLKELDKKCCKINSVVGNIQYPFETHFNTTPLIESASRGDFNIVRFLIVDVECNVNMTDGRGRSPLYRASERGHSDIVKLLLENNADVSQCNDNVNFPFSSAFKDIYADRVKLLLQNNVDMSQCKNYYRESPLCVACKQGFTNIVELLLYNNADISERNDLNEYPLTLACRGGYTDIVKLLLKNNADVSQCNALGESPLYVASMTGHTETVKVLLHKNADVSQCNALGESPLHVASITGHTEVVKVLLQKNLNFSKRNKWGWSPLYMACKGGHTEIVKLLLHNNTNVSKCDNCGKSPLYVASEGGHTATVEMLLQNKVNVSKCDRFSLKSPLYVACEGGHTDTVQLLLRYNADVTQCNRWEESPLIVACKEGHTQTVDLLLKNNADVSQCNMFGLSPLHVACAGGHTDIVNLLLQNNADVSKCDIGGKSPLFVDRKEEYSGTAELLLQINDDVSKCDSGGTSPLHVACKRGYTDIVKLLLQGHADVSECNQDQESPLYVACQGGHTDIVKLLLLNNADISKCEQKEGKSPLHAACDIDSFQPKGVWDQDLYKQKCSSQIATVKLLLAWNADAEIRDKNGQTPIDIARKSQSMDIVNILEKKKKHFNQTC